MSQSNEQQWKLLLLDALHQLKIPTKGYFIGGSQSEIYRQQFEEKIKGHGGGHLGGRIGSQQRGRRRGGSGIGGGGFGRCWRLVFRRRAG